MLLLLLDDTGAAQRAARPVVRPVPFERKAA